MVPAPALDLTTSLCVIAFSLFSGTPHEICPPPPLVGHKLNTTLGIGAATLTVSYYVPRAPMLEILILGIM